MSHKMRISCKIITNYSHFIRHFLNSYKEKLLTNCQYITSQCFNCSNKLFPQLLSINIFYLKKITLCSYLLLRDKNYCNDNLNEPCLALNPQKKLVIFI